MLINNSKPKIFFNEKYILNATVSSINLPHQWRNGSALKTSRREVPGSDPGGACRLSRSEFSVAFSETRVKTGKDTLGCLLRTALSP